MKFASHSFGCWRPTEAGSAIVLYGDRIVPALFLDGDFPATLMTIIAEIDPETPVDPRRLPVSPESLT